MGINALDFNFGFWTKVSAGSTESLTSSAINSKQDVSFKSQAARDKATCADPYSWKSGLAPKEYSLVCPAGNYNVMNCCF